MKKKRYTFKVSVIWQISITAESALTAKELVKSHFQQMKVNLKDKDIKLIKK